LARVFVVAGCLLCATGAVAAPRGLPPPMPEIVPVIYYEGFNEAYTNGMTNSQITIGNFTLVESWAGYALQRSGSTVTPFVVPAVDTNAHVNVTCDAGAIRLWFKPYWSSTTTNGTGPGDNARLLELAAVANGQSLVVWSLQANPNGTALNLIGESDNGPVVLINTPINWQTNQSHLIVLDYSTNETGLFIDGQLVSEGAGTEAIPPSFGELALGSTLAGLNTAGGDLDEVFSFSRPLTTNEVAFYYNGVSSFVAMGPITAAEEAQMAARRAAAAQWRASHPMALVVGGMSPMFSLDNCPTGGPVYITNVFTIMNTNQTITASFDLVGGTNGLMYDVFGATNLVGANGNLGGQQWVWLGRSQTCSAFIATNQTNAITFYILGTPLLASDGSGLTVAYENLVGSAFSSDGYSTPNAWYLQNGISPQTPGVGSQDPDQDGLLNYQEYLYGTNPNVSEGFAIWVSTPNGTTSIP